MNKPRKWTFLLTLLYTLCLSAHATPQLMAFYAPYERHLSTLDLELNQGALQHLDTLLYSASTFGLRPVDGTYRLYPVTDTNLRFLARYTKKHLPKLKLMLSLGYWNPERMRQTITVPRVRRRFIQSVINTLQNKAYRLSGVDIDWENEYWPIHDERKRFPIFIKQLRQAMNRHGLSRDSLSVDLPPNHMTDYPAVTTWLAYVSWANIMAYDFFGDTLDYSELDCPLGQNTTPYAGKPPSYQNLSLIGLLQYYRQHGLPVDKTVIVLPLYGMMMHVAHTGERYHDGLRQRVIGRHTPIDIPYWKIYLSSGTYGHEKNGYSAHKYTFHTPTDAKGSSSFWMTKGNHFLSYPDPIAIKQDTKYISQQGYLGISTWELTDALEYKNPASLIQAIVENR